MKTNGLALCTICARGGSKGVPSKNVKHLAGKPLIAYTIEQALVSELFEHVVVSTDSDEITEVAIKYGAEVFFKRPEEMATDNAAKLPVIRHAVIESEKHYSKKFPVIVDLDATSPLRTAGDLQEAIKLFFQNTYDNLFSVMPSRKSPYFNMVEQDENGRVFLSKKLSTPVVRRQDTPKCYDMNASIYIWKRDILMDNETIFLENTGIYIMPEERSIDIDCQIDFEFVEFMLSRRK